MGAGNVCVHNEFEEVFFVDYEENFPSREENEYGELSEPDYFLQEALVKEFIDELQVALKRRFKSFEYSEESTQDGRIILENGLFSIAVEDNQWSIAIKLLQKEQPYYQEGCLENLQARHFNSYKIGLLEKIYELTSTVYGYSGPWTSKRITESMLNEMKKSLAL